MDGLRRWLFGHCYTYRLPQPMSRDLHFILYTTIRIWL